MRTSCLLMLLPSAAAALRCAGPADLTDPPARPPASRPFAPALTRQLLDTSLALGRTYLLNNQRPAGTFTYEYDFVRRRLSRADNDVRQAGALWGLSLIHHDRPTPATAEAVRRGLAFFDQCSRAADDGRKYVVYPHSTVGHTGTVALIALALVDFLRTEADLPRSDADKYRRDLDAYIRFLLSARRKDGLFHQNYLLTTGRPAQDPSPYADGEALLALARAARYAAYEKLKDDICRSAEAMYQAHVVRALAADPDSRTTKGFYQWGSMAYHEIHAAGWDEDNRYPRRVIDLAHWMINVHRVRQRGRNTAYAYEGLVTAWEMARRIGDAAAMQKIGRVVDAGLANLTTWQVGSPVANAYLRVAHRMRDEQAVGGVMNSQADPVLRIDVTQHQMHAVILARRFIYTGQPRPPLTPGGRQR